jgi:flagellar hook-basal body complex protein FliE
MRVDSICLWCSNVPREPTPNIRPSVKFTDSLKELISDTNSLQKDSTELTEKMIKGEPVDLHDVMIAAEKAKTSFQLLLEMRNKFLDLYREVSRIQV